MSVRCKTSEELGKAIKNQEEYIEIEGDLKNKIIRIKAAGKVTWGVCIVALGTAITCYLATPAATVVTSPAGGQMVVASGITATLVATSTLGTAAVPAVLIGIAAGGVGALNTLRDKYKIVEKNSKYIKLQRK